MNESARSLLTSKHFLSLHFLQLVLLTTSTTQSSPPRAHRSYCLCSPTARRKKALQYYNEVYFIVKCTDSILLIFRTVYCTAPA